MAFPARFHEQILQACEHKSFSRSLVITNVVEFNLLMLVSFRTLHLKLKTSVSGLNLTSFVATRHCKKDLDSQACKYELVNKS